MSIVRKLVHATFFASSMLILVAVPARAGIVLESYEFSTNTTGATTLASNSIANGLTGMNFSASAGLTNNTASGYINTTGWNVSGVDYQFGFTVQAGNKVTISELDFATRSSGTGPGTVNIIASIDGGAFQVVDTLTQSGTTYNDVQYTLATPLIASQSAVFEFVAVNPTGATSDANGTAAIGSAGTFRVGDYAPGGTESSPFQIQGTVTPNAVPEPASVAMTGLGLLTAGALARRTRRAR